MYKISEKVINFTSKAMKNKNVKLTAGEKTEEEIKIESDIFQKDSRSPQQFIKKTLITLYSILKKYIGDHKFTKHKNNHHPYMDTNNKNIQSEYGNRILC